MINKNEFLISTVHGGNLTRVVEAINEGADIHSLDKSKWNALMHALYIDNIPIAMYLISIGAVLPDIVYTSSNMIIRLQELKYNRLISINN